MLSNRRCAHKMSDGGNRTHWCCKPYRHAVLIFAKIDGAGLEVLLGVEDETKVNLCAYLQLPSEFINRFSTESEIPPRQKCNAVIAFCLEHESIEAKLPQ
ncbi:hypothetical protein AGR8A_Lc50150 [Agrobacterium fabrum str. J-07]|nr:hypothetical protein AGR8A_Lc50150 [Agrobacterium fabrum str. J-07]